MIDLSIPEIRFAIDAVRSAARLAALVQAEMTSPALTKQDLSPVTVADFASQALVGSLLAKAFPGDPLVAEEDSAALREDASSLEQVTGFLSRFTRAATHSDVCAWVDRGAGAPDTRFWVLDPVDGTKGFLRGDQYAVALALIVNGMVEVGVLGCPNLSVASLAGSRSPVNSSGPQEGTLALAVRGQGAWIAPLDAGGEFSPLRVSGQSEPAHARLLRSFESGHTNVSQVDVLAETLGVAAAPVRMDSQAKYAVLAAGQGEIYLRFLSPDKPDYREKIWDQAAGSLLVEEAGGKVSDLLGRPLDFSAGRTLLHNRGVLATNGALHPATIRALAEMEA